MKVGLYKIPLTSKFPRPKPFWKLIGPVMIILGLSIGSGELIIWPMIVARYSFVLLWAGLISLIFQTIWTEEMARWTILTGEHFIQYIGRWIGLTTSVFLFGMIAWLSNGFPGWAAAAGTSLRALFDWPFDLISGTVFWASMGFIGGILISLGSKIVRKTVEKILTAQVIIMWFILLICVFTLTSMNDWIKFFKSLVENFGKIPPDVSWWTLASAVCFIGAGGISNIWYTFWIRDAGFGMGSLIGKIPGWRGKKTSIKLSGYLPKPTKENVRRVKSWISNLHKAFWLVFFLMNFLAISLFAVLSNVVLHRRNLVPSGFEIAVVQAEIFQSVAGRFGYFIFLFMIAMLLWGTQLSICEGIVRQLADTTYLVSRKVRKFVKRDIRKWYFYLFILFAVWGMVWIVLQEFFSELIKPDFFLFLSANVGLISQLISLVMLLYFQYFVAKKYLPKKLWDIYKPHPIRTVILLVAACFWSYFIGMAWTEKLGLLS